MGKIRNITQKSTFTITIAQKTNTWGHLPSANKAVVRRTRRVQHQGDLAILDSMPGSVTGSQHDLRQVPSNLRRPANPSCHSMVHLAAIFWGQGRFLWTRPKSMLLARIYLNSHVQTNTLRTDLIPFPLVLPSEPLTMPKYSPSSNAGMALLQEKVSSPWTARVCSSDQPTYTECCSQTKCEQPVWKRFISIRTAPYHRSHLPACMPAQQGGSCLGSGD